MNHAPKIELGRRIYMSLGMCGNDSRDGLIVAIHGEPGLHHDRVVGPMTVVNPKACRFDVITFDGTLFRDCRESDVNRQAIGGIRLLDRVHGPAMIERAHRLVAERDAEEARQRAEAPHRLAAHQAAQVIRQAPLFYWNGLKDAKGAELQKAWFSLGNTTGCPAGTITIYARDYDRFSALVRECFDVQNDTDTMTDYFDSDRIRVTPAHPLYGQVRGAWEAQEAHRAKREAKRGAR